MAERGMKVLLFDLFDSETIAPIDSEPVLMTPGLASGSFFVCSRAGEVLLYTLLPDRTFLRFPVFHTAAPSVLAFRFCPFIKSIITIEAESASALSNVARVYSVRSALSESPDSDDDLRGFFEIPVPGSVSALAVCELTGKLALATDSAVSLWQPVFDANNDLIAYDKMLQIDMHHVQLISIRENTIVCATKTCVKLFECVFADPVPETTGKLVIPSMKKLSLAIDDDFFISLTPDMFSGSGRGASSAIETITFDTKDDRTDRGKFTIYGPRSEIGHSVRVEPRFRLKSFHLLLHAQYEPFNVIHTVMLIPEYTPVHFNSDIKRATGLRLFVGTPHTGFLYNARKPDLLATYMFPNKTFSACAGASILYVTTKFGVDSYSLRTSINCAEFHTPPPCFIASQGSIRGASDVIMCGDYLVLMSVIYDGNLDAEPHRITPFTPYPGTKTANWVVYLFHPMSEENLYEQMSKRAENAYSTIVDLNQSEYYQLILEGHFLLQNKVSSLYTRIEENKDSLLSDSALALSTKLEYAHYDMLLRHSSSVLGNYFFNHTKEYHKAAQCYSESDMKLTDVNNIFADKEDSVKVALLEYFDRVLFDPKMAEFMVEDPDVSDEILLYYVAYAPHRLSTVIIDGCLHEYTQRNALSLLDVAQQRQYERLFNMPISAGEIEMEPPPKDLFAKALLHLDINEYSKALAVLKGIRSNNIVEFCQSNPSILCAQNPETGAVCPSILAQALHEASPYALLDVICSLPELACIEDVLLRNRTEPSSEDAAEESTFLRMCVLENTLMAAADVQGKLLNDPKKDVTLKHDECELTKAASDLAILYFGKIMESVKKMMAHPEDGSLKLFPQYPMSEHQMIERFTEIRGVQNVYKARLESCFFKWLDLHQKSFVYCRPLWLERLPFVIEDPIEVLNDKNWKMCPSPSPSKFGKDDLQGYDYDHFYMKKMQGLLCSGMMGSTDALLEKVRAAQEEVKDDRLASTYIEAVFALAMPLSSAPREERMARMVQSFPSVAQSFGAQFCLSSLDWKVILDALAKYIGSEERKDVRSAAMELYEAILTDICVKYSPTDFLTALPDNGSLTFFLRYIGKCNKHQLGNVLRQSLVDKMEEMEGKVRPFELV